MTSEASSVSSNASSAVHKGPTKGSDARWKSDTISDENLRKRPRLDVASGGPGSHRGAIWQIGPTADGSLPVGTRPNTAIGTEDGHHPMKGSPSRKRDAAEKSVRTPVKQTKVLRADGQHGRMESPIKEITVHHRDDLRSDLVRRLRKAPDDLDEGTMELLMGYLQENQPAAYLNDEEITAFMTRLNRLADRQTEYQHHLTGDSDESDSSLFNEILSEEEEFAIGQAFFKEIVSGIRNETDYELDPRTLTWIRRAAGLHRSKTEMQVRESNNEAGKDHRIVKTRMSTRQQKVQRRDKCIDLLVAALDDVEDEIGKFMQVEITAKQDRSPSHPSPLTPPGEDVAPKKSRAEVLKEKFGKKLVAKILTKKILPNGLSFDKYRLIRISHMIVNGTRFYLKRDSNEPYLRATSTSRHMGDGARRRTEPRQRQIYSMDLNLKRALWRRSEGISIMENAFKTSETKEIYANVVRTRVPGAIRAAGLTFRLPQWETLNKTSLTALDPPRQRHHDDVYATLSMKIVRSLKGKLHSWSLHEFFYCDIEREWYNRNDIVEELPRLGLSRNVMLTAQQWKLVRQKVKGKPRRFTRRFIESQRKELKEYRDAVRRIQLSSAETATAKFDYDIPAAIAFGTVVTVFSAKYRTLLRGVVLTHEPATFSYLVLYDRREFGLEYCEDIDVASHGGPRILYPRERQCGLTELTTCGSAKGSFADSLRLQPIELRNEMKKFLIFDPSPGSTNPQTDNTHVMEDEKLEAVRRVAENETMTGLLTILDVATRRKEMLLQALDVAHNVAATGGDFSLQFRYSYEWLTKNLRHTNQVLEAALPKLRLMYGKLYMPSSSSPEPGRERYSFLEKGLDTVRVPSSLLGRQWATRLSSEASKVSELMTSIVMNRAKNDSRGAPVPEQDLQLIENLLRPVGSLLLTSSYGQQYSQTNGFADYEPLGSSLVVASQALLERSKIPDDVEADELYVIAKAGRDAAKEDLQAALAQLQTEIILSAAQKSLAIPEPT